MPAYDYRCTICRHTFEVVRAATETDAPPCPECGAATKRVFTPVGIHFKGSGFHNTDYRKQLPAEDKKGELPASTGGGCPAAAGGDCSGCPGAE